MSIRALLTILILMFGINHWAQGATLYRYKDENGVIVMGRTIPPELVSGGYTVLNEQGAVIRVVPPALTEEQKTRQRELEENERNQQARDEELLRLYRSPDDVDRAMQAWMSRLNVEISLKNNQLSVKRAELSDAQSRAAEYERRGEPVPEAILEELEQIKTEMADIRASIRDVEQKKKQDQARFERDRKRINELLGSS